MRKRRAIARSSAHAEAELRRIIRSVRRRWRFRLLIQGAAVVLAGGLVVVWLSSFGIDRLRFEPGAVLGFRIVAYLLILALVAWFLLRPLLRRVTDERVALYLEEHEPSLEATVLTGVQAGESTLGGTDGSPPGALLGQVVTEAVLRSRRVEGGRRVERRRLGRASAWLTGSLMAMAFLTLGAPGFLGDAAPLILSPWRDAAGASPYTILVEPGNSRIARGADQKVTALPGGFEAQVAEILVHRGEGDWERWPMTPEAESGRFEVLLFDLKETVDYLVEAEGVRSPTYRIEVVDLPYVDRLDLEYHFPDYTGLDPQFVEDGGDIAALRGTRVIVRVTPTIPVSAGRIVLDREGEGAEGTEGTEAVVELRLGEGGLVGELRVEREAFYRIELLDSDGDYVVASPEYLIRPLEDQPPAVTIVKPGRDRRATAIEELFAEVEAEDDYGIGSLELVYSVNSGSEVRMSLYRARGAGRKDVTGAHTFFLEEMELRPGDLIAYYARASDRNRVAAPQTATSDMYFIEIQPFDRSYRQADQAPGAGGGGMGGGLSEQQRQIVAATFNLVRDRDDYDQKEFGENLATLTLLQGRLREEVKKLLDQMRQRGVAADSSFRVIAEELNLAQEEMTAAEDHLGLRKPTEALPPEQRALQHLQRAEAVFRDVQVSFGGSGGGGGGGGSQAEDLADLFELEMDRLRNQYETVQRGEREQRDEQVDEALQRLQELARRQEQINQRARQAGPAGAEGGGAQERLIEETEELARRLERLSREESNPDLSRSARRLRQAAEEMRRAAASGGEGRGGEALDRLRETRRLLESRQTAALERDVEEARRRAERIVDRQQGISADVQRTLRESGEQPPPADQLRALGARKEELAEEVASLEADLDRLARESRRERPEVSRELKAGAGSIRDNKLREKILYSRGVLGARSEEFARNFEDEITRNAEELREALERATGALGQAGEAGIERRLEEAQDLVQRLESLRERVQGHGGEASNGEDPEGQGGPPGGLAPAAVRQLRREFGERRREAVALREGLNQAGIDTRELAAVIARLQELDADRAYQDREEIDRLQASIIQALKEFEFALRREHGLGGERKLFLSGSDAVPEGYRALVEEYYRSLSREPPR